MANIHIARDHKPHGVFTEDEIRDGIRDGKFLADDLAWRQGMSGWKPLGEMAPQWGMEMPPPALGPASAETRAAAEGDEPAWEERDRLGLFPAIFRTVQAVLTRPTPTFAALRQTGGLANPLLYFVLLSSAMFAVSAFYQMAAASVNPKVFGSGLPALSGKGFQVVLLGSILISPALYVVGAFISSGVTHLCLRLLGGAEKPFETTFRVICYAQASAAVLNIFPMCGGLLAVVMAGYCIIVGLREAHGISGWKATLALVLPGLICCGILLFLATAAGVGIAELGKAAR